MSVLISVLNFRKARFLHPAPPPKFSVAAVHLHQSYNLNVRYCSRYKPVSCSLTFCFCFLLFFLSFSSFSVWAEPERGVGRRVFLYLSFFYPSLN